MILIWDSLSWGCSSILAISLVFWSLHRISLEAFDIVVCSVWCLSSWQHWLSLDHLTSWISARFTIPIILSITQLLDNVFLSLSLKLKCCSWDFLKEKQKEAGHKMLGPNDHHFLSDFQILKVISGLITPFFRRSKQSTKMRFFYTIDNDIALK